MIYDICDLLYTYIYIYMYTYISVLYVCIHTYYKYICVYVYIYIYMYIYIYILCIYIYIYICICVRTSKQSLAGFPINIARAHGQEGGPQHKPPAGVSNERSVGARIIRMDAYATRMIMVHYRMCTNYTYITLHN